MCLWAWFSPAGQGQAGQADAPPQQEGGREIQRSLPLGQGGYPPVGGPHEHQGDGQHGQDQGEVPLWGASFLRETLSIEYNARTPQFVTEFHKNFLFFQRGPQKSPFYFLYVATPPLSCTISKKISSRFPYPGSPPRPPQKNPPNPKNPVRFLWEYGKIKRSHWQGTPFPAVFSEGSPVSCGNLSCSPP